MTLMMKMDAIRLELTWRKIQLTVIEVKTWKWTDFLTVMKCWLFVKVDYGVSLLGL